MNPYRRSLLLALCAPAAAWADSLSADDRRAVRATIENQLQALASGDAARAFSHASPDIRRQFGDAATFFAMVIQGYPMVIRPAGTVFYEPRLIAGAVLQDLQLRDAAGRNWLATYQLVQLVEQPGRPWRINGVVVVADSGKSST